MANPFDHIEKSVRNAFEEFEMPVSDMDWSRIDSALPEEKKKRGFLVWWKKNGGKGLAILAFLTVSTGIGYYISNQNHSAKPNAARAAVVTENAPTNGPALQTPADLEAGLNNRIPVNESLQEHISRSTNSEKAPIGNKKPQSKATTKPSYISANATAQGQEPLPKVDAKPQVVATPSPAATPNGNHATATVEPPETAPNHRGLKSVAIRVVQLVFPSLIPSLRLNDNNIVRKSARPTTPPPHGLQLYTSLSSSYAPGKVQGGTGTGLWEGVTWLHGKNPALNLRLETGLEVGKTWKFTAGAAVEGNPMASKSTDSIRIRIADRFLPYYDQNGVLLYMLARRWHDSVIVLTQNTQRTWIELPLGMRRTWNLGSNFKLSTGLSFNPGILIGNNGQIANPYQTFSGSYLKYQYGIHADTTAALAPAGQFLNTVRLGNGLQVGLQKDMKHFYWGVELSSRYYYTPVWKTGIPIKQNTLQYGLNLRVGFKL